MRFRIFSWKSQLLRQRAYLFTLHSQAWRVLVCLGMDGGAPGGLAGISAVGLCHSVSVYSGWNIRRSVIFLQCKVGT